MHIKDPYKEISIGLDGRDEELCKPLLQLFYTLGASEETLRELEDTLQYFLDTKNKRKGQTLEAIIFPVIVNIVSEYGERIQSSKLWGLIKDSLEGQLDEKNSNLFYSSDYGKIYRNTVTAMICDKFSAEIDHRRDGNDILFNSKTLSRIGKIYQTNHINTKPLCDAVTHRDHCEGQDTTLNNIGGNTSTLENLTNLSNNDLLEGKKDNEPVNHDDHDESLNHTKEQCPYCDHEDHPFFIKLHIRNVHPEQG